MQQYADIYLLLNYSIYFGRPSRSSSGVHKTVVAVSGTDHTIWEASFFKSDLIWSRLKKKADHCLKRCRRLWSATFPYHYLQYVCKLMLPYINYAQFCYITRLQKR